MDYNQTENDSMSNEAYTEDLGSLAIKSAVMQYVSSLNEDQATTFTAYIEAHVEEETFFVDICKEYPEFGKILETEMLLLQKELDQITPQ